LGIGNVAKWHPSRDNDCQGGPSDYGRRLGFCRWGAGKIMGAIAFLFGIANYLVFFASFLDGVGFVNDLPVPKTID
jgi:hypothetical protein